MALRRKVTEKLQRWKNSSIKALLVVGARQVGKSYAIREFGSSSFDCLLEINLYHNSSAREALVAARNVEDFLNVLSLLARKPLVPGRTLIFLDEIQEYPDLVTMLKFLVEDGRYRYAFSGSMLGTEFKGIRSFPVGYVEEIRMHPLDFEEFLWGVNFPSQLFAQTRDHFEKETAVETYLHDALMRDFRSYIIVGGMPEVVQHYIDEGNSLNEVRSLQADLNEQYRVDIGKYAGARALAVKEIFDQLPAQLSEDAARFSVTALGASARYQNKAADFLWLVNAGVAVKVNRITEAKFPLRRTEKPALFKLFQSDTGMLVQRYPKSMARELYLDYRAPNLGALYENVIAQEMAAHGLRPYYFDKAPLGEVDFVIEDSRGAVVPIEVKSGKQFRRHAALDRLLASKEPGIKEGVVLCNRNVERAGNVLYLPLYMAGFLGREWLDQDDFILSPALA